MLLSAQVVLGLKSRGDAQLEFVTSSGGTMSSSSTRSSTASAIVRCATAINAVAVLTVFAQYAKAWAIETSTARAPSSTPMYKTADKGTGSADGNWRLANKGSGLQSISSGYAKINNADNHKVYIRMITQSNAGTCKSNSTSYSYDYRGTVSSSSQSYSCTQPYFDYEGSKAGDHMNKATGTVMNAPYTSVDTRGSKARALIQVCLDIPVRSDPCTGWASTAADSY